MQENLSTTRKLEIIGWEFVSFWGTILAGFLFLILAFVLDINFGLIATLNLVLITFVSNFYKLIRWKARPDNPEKIRPEKPFPMWHFWKYLNPKNSIAMFKYVDSGSFPSIHSARSFNFAWLFAYYFGPIWFAPLLILAALIGVSRVVKLRHFLTDVFGGLVLGILMGILSMPWIDKLVG